MKKIEENNFQFQLRNVKGLEATIPILTTRKRLDKLKINSFSWTHQRTEVAGKTTTLKPGETGTSRETKMRSIYLKQKLLDP